MIKCIVDNVNDKSLEKHLDNVQNIKESNQELCEEITLTQYNQHDWKSEKYTEFEKSEISNFLRQSSVRSYSFFAFDVTLRIVKETEIERNGKFPGRIKYAVKKTTYYTIQKKEDDWFYVHRESIGTTNLGDEYRISDDDKFYKIDGYDGLIQYLEKNI